MEYVIYKLTNKINGKAYVGKTYNLTERLKGHLNSDCCRAIHRALLKYGIENFNIEIISKSNNEDELANLEYKMILEHETMTPKGYNLTLETNQGRIPSQESRDLMSSSRQGKVFNDKFKSKYIGVRNRIQFGHNYFDCRVSFRKEKFVRSFSDEVQAAECYDRLVLFLHGQNAIINFPEKRGKFLKEDLSSFFNEVARNKQGNTSKYNGVSFHKISNKWRSVYHFHKLRGGKQIALGLFESEIEAAEMHDKFLIFINSNISLNFPEKRAIYNKEDIKEFFKEFFTKKNRGRKNKEIYNEILNKYL